MHLLLLAILGSLAIALSTRAAVPLLSECQPSKAPTPSRLVLRSGDRLAICGDSITEQKMYSRVIETYLTVCSPELGVQVRQYGWGGETAAGFLRRMTNDCLRFQPTIATTCYGMNDHGYRPYEEKIGRDYRSNSTAIVKAFKAHGTRVIHGSPGCVGKRPHWSKDPAATVDALNLNLCQLRNIGVEIAKAEKVGFADVFQPMLTAGYVAQQRYGTNYAIAGGDGVHPGWSGSFVMAYAFLKALGLDGEIGKITVDLRSGKAKVTSGHTLVTATAGRWQIQSTRYPYCGTNAVLDVGSDNSIRSAMALVPFNEELNRLILVANNSDAKQYTVTWGTQQRRYDAAALAQGVNFAADFPSNPFSEAFAAVDQAVAAKQAFETRQIKQLFRAPEAKANFEAIVAETERERAALVNKITAAFAPVTHELRIAAE